jgi:zinc transport system substrate-binding protein
MSKQREEITMKSLLYKTTLLIVLISLALVSCGPANPQSSDKLNVTVSILPEKYFTERIGGDYVTVNVMVAPGDSPHTYEPKPEQMTALSNSSVYFRIGVEFENAWMDRISSANPKMKIVDVSDGIQKIPSTEKGEEGELDPHVWTSPSNAKIIAQNIYQSIAQADPEHAEAYQSNLDALLQDITDLDQEIRTTLNGIQNNKFMVFHPGWAYFARDYNLEQIAIEIGGTEPSAQELADLIDTAKKDNIQVVFGQPQFSTKTAEYIAKEIGGKVILIDNLSEDWLDNMRTVSQTFAEVLKN